MSDRDGGGSGGRPARGRGRVGRRRATVVRPTAVHAAQLQLAGQGPVALASAPVGVGVVPMAPPPPPGVVAPAGGPAAPPAPLPVGPGVVAPVPPPPAAPVPVPVVPVPAAVGGAGGRPVRQRQRPAECWTGSPSASRVPRPPVVSYAERPPHCHCLVMCVGRCKQRR